MSTANPNQDICEMLTKLGEYERDVNGIQHKYFAYRKACKALESIDTRVKSGAEAQKLPGIGPKIGQKIDEFLAGDVDMTPAPKSDDQKFVSKNVSETAPADTNPLIIDCCEKLLMSKLDAMRLQFNRVNTISELKTRIDLITAPQITCLKNFSDLYKSIPREEIKSIFKQIKQAIEKFNKYILITVCGSFRRKANESEFIDLLLVHSKMKSTKSDTCSLLKENLEEIAKLLEKDNLLKERLFIEEDSLSGLVQLKNSTPIRRINIHLVPKDYFVCRLFYLTGSQTFVNQIVQHALSSGYILDKNNLRRIGYTCVPGQPIPLESEEDLFEIIQHPFKKPEERSV